MLQRPSLPSYRAILCPAHTGISARRCSLPGRSNQTQWETRTSTRVCVHPDTRTFVQVGGQARTAWARSSRQRGLRARRRSEEHTSELQSRLHLVCRLLLEKKKKKTTGTSLTSTRQLRPKRLR